jgi:hypothetical protein
MKSGDVTGGVVSDGAWEAYRSQFTRTEFMILIIIYGFGR